MGRDCDAVSGRHYCIRYSTGQELLVIGLPFIQDRPCPWTCCANVPSDKGGAITESNLPNPRRVAASSRVHGYTGCADHLHFFDSWHASLRTVEAWRRDRPQ